MQAKQVDIGLSQTCIPSTMFSSYDILIISEAFEDASTFLARETSLSSKFLLDEIQILPKIQKNHNKIFVQILL